MALGIIVLAGVNRSDDSLRRFATTLVNRPGPRVLVWTEEDLNALAAEQPPWDGTESGAYQRAPESQSSFGIAYAPGAIQHTGRYWPLSEWLRRQDSQPIRLTFDELEERTGITLPEPCRHHVFRWKSYQDSVVARAIRQLVRRRGAPRGQLRGAQSRPATVPELTEPVRSRDVRPAQKGTTAPVRRDTRSHTISGNQRHSDRRTSWSGSSSPAQESASA